jgi:serine/threonine protein kinase
MTTLSRCINGHEWRASQNANGAVCPVCGSGEKTLLTPPTFPEPGRSFSLDAEGSQGPPILAGYEVLEELGRGGMGIVYKARHRETGNVVALKVIRKERLGSSDLIGRFKREALASSRLQHPNLVQVYEADLAGEQPYMAIEYVPGMTLQQLVETNGALPVAMACDFIRQTALALKHANEQRLVHRDIKPSNLMVLAPHGLPLPPRPIVKVLDMGVARLFQSPDHESPLTTLTRDGSVIGTPDYIAPEQLENPRGVDIRADLYSLGCMFYFLLTAQVPFPGGSLVQKLDRQRWQVAPSVTQLRPEVPAGVAAIVRKLMNKDREDRFQTPDELIAALEGLLKAGDLPGTAHLATLTPVVELVGHKGNASALTWAGGLLVSGGADRTIRVWDVAKGQELRRCGDGKLEAVCLAAAPGGVILAGQGVTVRGYSVATGRETLRLVGHADAVRAVAVSADGKRALTGGDDRSVRLWDLERSTQMTRFTKHTGGVTGVALSPDGKFAASGGTDQTLRVWDVVSGRELRSFAVPRGRVLCVAWSADGKTVFSGHFDTTLRQWDVATGHEVRRFIGHKQMVNALALAGDGTLISASNDQTVRLWDVAAGGEVGIAPGHTGPVSVVAANGERFASAGADGTVRVWRLGG